MVWLLGIILIAVFFLGRLRGKKRFLQTPLQLKIRSWIQYGDAYFSLVLEGEHCEQLPKWKGGSHIVLEVPGERGLSRRAYSLVGGDRQTYEIVVAMRQEGKVSSPILNDLYTGKSVLALPPRGRFFKFVQSESNSVCLIGGGVGLAPLVPIAKEAMQRGLVVHLIHAARYERELIKSDELRALAEQNSYFSYTPILSRDFESGSHSIVGRISPALLRKCGMHQFEGDFYICGSWNFVTDIERMVREVSCPGEIYKEAFAGNSTDSPFVIRAGGKKFQQGYAPTLLAALEENGILPFAECRSGQCLNCRVKLTGGSVETINETRDKPDSDGMILACACIPKSDIILDLPKRLG